MSSDPLDIRIRRYVPAGAAGGIIPAASLDWTAPLGDVSTLNFTVSETVAGTIPDLCEFAVEIFDGTGWKEPHAGRFMNQRHSGDDLDQAGIKNLTCVSFIHWMLAKAEFQTPEGDDQEFDGTAGSILRTMIDAAQARGWGTFIRVTFNANTDSAGQPWNDAARVEMSFRDGTTLATALQTLADQGVLEYVTEGRTLHVFNPGHGSDISGGSERSTVGAKVQAMPVEVTNEDLLTSVTVRGEDDRWNFPVPGGVTALGRLEGSVQASGVTKQAQAVRFAELLQATGKAPRTQYTISESAAAMDARPFIDYGLGDWVSARRPAGWERMRVTEVQVHRDGAAVVTADITLEDRLTDLAARLAKRNAALGAKLAGNGYVAGRISSATLRDLIGGIGGGGGEGGAGFPNPKPEYGSGWPSAGPNFEWGSEGSDPNTTPVFAENGFTVSEVRINVGLPGIDAVQNEGNLIFTATPMERPHVLKYYVRAGTAMPDMPDMLAFRTMEPASSIMADGDGFDWLPGDPEHDPIIDPIDKPAEPVEEPVEEEEDEKEPVEPPKPRGTLPMESWGSIRLSSGYLYGGQVHDWGERINADLNGRIISDLIAGSSAGKNNHGAYSWTDMYTGELRTTGYVEQYASIYPEHRPFSSAGWLYIPVRVEVAWGAYDGADEYPLHTRYSYSLRFLRSKITNHLTLGELEAVTKADIPYVGEDHLGRITSTTRAGNQILISVTAERAKKLYCATFTQSGDIQEESFSNAPHPGGSLENLGPAEFFIAKSLDGSGMSLFSRMGQELLLAENNVRRRTEDTLWTGTPVDHQGGFAVAAGRSVTFRFPPGSGGPAQDNIRLGVFESGGHITWTGPPDGDNGSTSGDATWSYGGYVYGIYNGQSGFSVKLTPA